MKPLKSCGNSVHSCSIENNPANASGVFSIENAENEVGPVSYIIIIFKYYMHKYIYLTNDCH